MRSSSPTTSQPRPLRAIAAVLVLWLWGCAGGEPRSAAPSVAATGSPPVASGPPPGAPVVRRLVLIEDDLPRAQRRARAEGKLLFIEASAPWCHTCLSMKHYVLTDPSLVPLSERVVFATIDTDRPQHAAFLERHPVGVWPTMFVLDPATDQVLGYWPGAASVGELRNLLQRSLDGADAAHEPRGPLAALVAGNRAQARGAYGEAATSYEQALSRSAVGWPRRSEALLGWIASEYRQEHWQRCAELGTSHVGAVQGAALPTDFSYLLLRCADRVGDQALQARARSRVLDRLRKHTSTPPRAASIDDRADAWGLLARVLRQSGEPAQARQSTERQLALLERAAAAAATPAAAATFDYGRMTAYLELGRGDAAVSMLRERSGQLPNRYEPRARLAQTLMQLERWSEALEPIDGAIERSYGPRQLRYLGMRADILAKLGRPAEQRTALERLLTAYEALPAAQQAQPQLRASVEKSRAELGRLKGSAAPVR